MEHLQKKLLKKKLHKANPEREAKLGEAVLQAWKEDEAMRILKEKNPSRDIHILKSALIHF